MIQPIPRMDTGGCRNYPRYSPALPYRQGQLGGLCGLYSVVNALRLTAQAHRALTSAQCEQLYRHGISVIAARQSLALVACTGMDPALRHVLVDELVALTHAMGVTVHATRPFQSRPGVPYAAIANELVAAVDERVPALITLGGTHCHYTVARGHTPQRWLLFDSSGLQWLAKRAGGSARSSKRHAFDAASIQLLKVVP